MKVNIKIPTDLKDIKLSQYQKFIKTTKDSEDEVFIAKQIVGIFCNLTDNTVNQILAKDFTDIVNSITEVLNKKHELVPTFKLDGVEYGFIPKLDDITIGEKIDLDTFLQDVNTMDNAMGVMYRPITNKHNNGYLIEPHGKDIISLDVTLDIAFGANGFFLTLMNDLLNFTQSYIEQEAVQNPKVSQILEQNGVGILAFTESLSLTISQLTKLVNVDYTMN